MNRRAVLLAVAVALVAVLTGSTLLPAVGSAFGFWGVASGGWRLWSLMGSGRFNQLSGAKDVYRFDLWWRPLPVVLLPMSATLVRDGSSWALIDAGAGDSWSQSYASRLVEAVQRAIPPGDRLAAVLLTHAHFDHVGALPALLRAHPDAAVVVHEREAPFLTGEAQYPYMPPGSVAQRVLLAIGIVPSKFVQLPESRLTLLHGAQGGSLRQYSFGSLSWVPTPGHSPGHVSFLHEPSGTLVAGDAIFEVIPSVSWASGIEAVVTKPLGMVAGSAARLAAAPARAVLGGLLGGRAVSAALNSTMGALSTERLFSGAMTALTSGGSPLSISVAPQSAGVGQILGTFKPMRLLPGITVRLSPSIVCPHPHCDLAEAAASVCRLSKLPFKRLIPYHDATGRGLGPADVAAFCKALPSAAQQAAA